MKEFTFLTIAPFHSLLYVVVIYRYVLCLSCFHKAVTFVRRKEGRMGLLLG